MEVSLKELGMHISSVVYASKGMVSSEISSSSRRSLPIALRHIPSTLSQSCSIMSGEMSTSHAIVVGRCAGQGNQLHHADDNFGEHCVGAVVGVVRCS